MEVDEPPPVVVPYRGVGVVRNYPGSSPRIDGRIPHRFGGGWLCGQDQHKFFIVARHLKGMRFGADVMKVIRDKFHALVMTFNKQNFPTLAAHYRLSGTTVQSMDVAMILEPDGKLTFGTEEIMITVDLPEVMRREPVTADPREILDGEGRVINKPSDFQRVSSPNTLPTLRLLGLSGEYKWRFEQADITTCVVPGGGDVAGGFVRPFHGQLMLTIKNQGRDSFLEFKVNRGVRRLGWQPAGHGFGRELLDQA